MKHWLVIVGITAASMCANAQLVKLNGRSATQAATSASGAGADLATDNSVASGLAIEHSVTTAREAGSGMATGRQAAPGKQKSGNTAVNGNGGMATGVAPGTVQVRTAASADADADGVTQPASAQVKATKTRSNIQNNRVAAGDVDGDGRAEVAASADGSTKPKGHYDVKNQTGARVAADCSAQSTPAVECTQAGEAASKSTPVTRSNISNNREAGSGMATGKRQ